MHNRLLSHFIIILIACLVPGCLFAQEPVIRQDTFFLAKAKGVLGRLGRSISTYDLDKVPEKVANPFLAYKGRTIRSIEFAGFDFGTSIYDSSQKKNNFGVRLAKAFHKNTTAKVTRRNLFFKQGDQLSPYLLADNERYLRELKYIQDARILVRPVPNSNFVDVIIMTKDIFSLGGSASINSKTKGSAEIREENLSGSGTRIAFSGFYDKDRSPEGGYGAEFTKRNIGGSFIDLSAGFKNYRTAFSSDKDEEKNIYIKLEKPLVTPYIPSTGSIEAAYYKTSNGYVPDSLYKNDFNYEYHLLDGWFGYSLDSKRALYANKEISVHKFIALRAFDQYFSSRPDKFNTEYDYRYANMTGALASLNIFKQSFYKTSFIYGFGRSEDVPEGFSVALTGGWLKKQNIKRPYAGVDVELTSFNRSGYHSNFTFKAGGFFYQKRFEDVDLLFNIEHFTRLKKMRSNWYQRFFFNTGITGQVNPVLNAPLFLNSIYGLPYFNNGSVNADFRYSLKAESVFYNTDKILGFRFAPFVFSELSALKPTKQILKKTELYSAVGAGVRTRNENLVFGTVEIKGYYFPRRNGDMHGFAVELSSNIRFKYNSSFIKRPDFIIAN